MTVADDVYTMERLEDVLKRDQTTFENIEIDFSTVWNEQRGAWQYQRSLRCTIHNIARMLWFTTCKGDLLTVVYSSGGVDIHIDVEQFTMGAPDDWGIRAWIAQMAKELMP
jgi:hypothetical protein